MQSPMADAIGSPVSSRSLQASPVTSPSHDGRASMENPEAHDAAAITSHGAADLQELNSAGAAGTVRDGTAAGTEEAAGVTSQDRNGTVNGVRLDDETGSLKDGELGGTSSRGEADKNSSHSSEQDDAKARDKDDEEDSRDGDKDDSKRRDRDKDRGRGKERDRKRRYSSSRSFSPKRRNTDKIHRRSASPRRSRSRSPKHPGRSKSRSPRRGSGRAYSPRRRSRSFSRRSRSRSNSRRSRSRSRSRTPPRYRSAYNYSSRGRGSIPPCVDMVNLLPSVRGALVQLYERSILKYTDLDVTCLDVLKTLTEREGLQALEDLAHINFAKVRNLPAFFVGICRKISQASYMPSMGGWGRERSSRDRSRERERERVRGRDRVRDSRLYSRDKERERRAASPSSSGGYEHRARRHGRDASPSNAASRDSRREWWRDNDAPESRRSEHTSSWVPPSEDIRPMSSPPRSSPAPKLHSTQQQQQQQQPPAYTGPSTSAPAYTGPNSNAPAYTAPSSNAPTYTAPSTSAPGYTAPSTSAPAYTGPSTSAALEQQPSDVMAERQPGQTAQQEASPHNDFPPPPPLSPVTPTPDHTEECTIPITSGDLPLPPPPPLPFPPSGATEASKLSPTPLTNLNDSLVPPHLVGHIPQTATNSVMPTQASYVASSAPKDDHSLALNSNISTAPPASSQPLGAMKPNLAPLNVPTSSVPHSSSTTVLPMSHGSRPMQDSYNSHVRPAASSVSDAPMNRVGTVWLADGTQLHNTYRPDSSSHSSSDLPNNRSTAPYGEHHEALLNSTAAPAGYSHRHTTQFSSSPYPAAQAPRHVSQANTHVSTTHQTSSTVAPTYVVTARADTAETRYYSAQPLQQVRVASADVYPAERERYPAATNATAGPTIVSLSAAPSTSTRPSLTPHSSVHTRSYSLHSQVPIVDTLDHARLHVDGPERVHVSQDSRHVNMSNSAQLDRLLDPRVNGPPPRVSTASHSNAWSPGPEPINNPQPSAHTIVGGKTTATTTTQYYVNTTSTTNNVQHIPSHQPHYHVTRGHAGGPQEVIVYTSSASNTMHASANGQLYSTNTAGLIPTHTPAPSFPPAGAMGAPSHPQSMSGVNSNGLDSQLQQASMLRNAVMEVVKDLMKPAWKSQRLSREDFKTIARKAVDKVLLTVPKGMPVDSPAAVTEFLSEARKEKIKRLVDGYLHKYDMTHAAGIPMAGAHDAGPHIAPAMVM